MERFVNDILAECPGCPTIIIKRKVLQAAIRFCEKSWAWREKISVDVNKGDSIVPITLFNDATIAGIVYVTAGGDYPFTRELDLITFDEPASEKFTLDLTLAIKPTRDVAVLEDIFVDDWYDGIEVGAKAALMVMPGKPWYNPSLSSFYITAAREYITEARIKANKKNDITSLRVVPRRFV